MSFPKRTCSTWMIFCKTVGRAMWPIIDVSTWRASRLMTSACSEVVESRCDWRTTSNKENHSFWRRARFTWKSHPILRKERRQTARSLQAQTSRCFSKSLFTFRWHSWTTSSTDDISLSSKASRSSEEKKHWGAKSKCEYFSKIAKRIWKQPLGFHRNKPTNSAVFIWKPGSHVHLRNSIITCHLVQLL